MPPTQPDLRCRLRVTHDQLRDGANSALLGGWPMILSGLKTLIETGEQLDPPGSFTVAGLSAGKRPAQGLGCQSLTRLPEPWDDFQLRVSPQPDRSSMSSHESK
jgi:hypothetical protein